jgi:hypothetical protein
MCACYGWELFNLGMFLKDARSSLIDQPIDIALNQLTRQ